MRNSELVKQFWDLFDRREYVRAGELLDEDFQCLWPCTGETFGKEAFIAVNVEYPGRWSTKLQKFFEAGDAILSYVYVYSEDSEHSFYVNTIFSFTGGKIGGIEEYWSPVENPPEWRTRSS